MIAAFLSSSTSAVQVSPVAQPEEMGWTKVGASSPSEKVSFTMNLVPRNMKALKARALAASTPGHADYGKFMTTQEIHELTSPTEASVQRVRAWLLENDVSTFEVKRENVFVKTTVDKASKLLGTSFSAYQMDGRTLHKAADYSLPDEVAEVTATTLGLHGLPAPRQDPILVNSTSPTAVNPPAVTPSVIASTYNIKNPYVNKQGTQRQGVAEFQGQYMNKADLVDFFQNEVPGFTAGEDDVSKFVGAPYKKGNGVEADLDIQFIMGVAPGVKTDFFEWPELDFCSDLLSYTSALLESDSIVNSISYGFQGNLEQLNCKTSDVTAVDNNWAKLAAKGVSVMISSGDSGSGYTRSGLSYKLYPSWPASSPWVTAVGATCFIDAKVGNGEMASSQFGSGGGFSTQFDQTDAQWQKDAVAKYVAMGPSLEKFPPASKFPATGRATPDVSALGEGFQVYVNGKANAVGGTSASSPTFAAMVSLINEERLKAGKKQMGFLNPFLYANADAFYDVTKGTNAEGRGPFTSPYGYAAAEGWDAATGLGTPYFDKLLSAAMKASGASTVEAA